MAILKSIGTLFIVVPLVVLFARYVLARVYAWALNHNSSEIFRATLVLLMASAFYFSREVGLGIALGGFIAGISVSEVRASRHILNESGPAKDLFGSLFFIVVGMLVDLRVVQEQAQLILVLVGTIIVVKAVTAAIPLAMLGVPFRVAIGVGLVVSQVGEFSFVLATTGRSTQLISEEMFKIFVAVSVLTMTINPLLLGLVRPLERLLGDRRLKLVQDNGITQDIQREQPLPDTLAGHTVIVGWGSVAQVLTPALRSLQAEGQPPEGVARVVVIESEAEHVAEARAAGVDAYLGSSEHVSVLERAKIGTAGLFVVAAGDIFPKVEAVRHARRLNPNLKIVARASYKSDEARLYDAGANFVITDDTAAAREVVDISARLANLSPEVRDNIWKEAMLERERQHPQH
jgi:CPA2 family monovalent cation:H+ antiporter-2